MRTTNQVSIYCVFFENGRYFYILVKRNKDRGGFWQPLTGGEEDFDKGDLLETVVRETREELGIVVAKEQIFKIPYSFKFIDRDGIERTEYCFGVIIPMGIKNGINLSDEHTAIIYASELEYLRSLLKFEENRIGLNEFSKLIVKK